jgi:hypothetical protein
MSIFCSKRTHPVPATFFIRTKWRYLAMPMFALRLFLTKHPTEGSFQAIYLLAHWPDWAAV